MTGSEVKKALFSMGADLCGIAVPERFADAPKGYHPLDVMSECKSVISFAVRFPAGTLTAHSHVPYTRVRNSITPKMDAIALDLCIRLEDAGYLSLPIPTNESEWDVKTGRWRSIVSQKHAAQAAGLGRIGKHSLLITPEFGSMVWLGCVLTEAEFAPDPLKGDICNGCNLCVAACPSGALGNEAPDIRQSVCWDYAFGDDTDKKNWVISCHACRDACPFNFGTRNARLRR